MPVGRIGRIPGLPQTLPIVTVYQHGLKLMLLQLYKWREGAASNSIMSVFEIRLNHQVDKYSLLQVIH